MLRFKTKRSSCHSLQVAVDVEVSKVITRYGKIGSHGQTTVKDEGSSETALKTHDKLIREQIGMGYIERSAPAESAPSGKLLEATRPHSSSPEVVTFLQSIGLQAELDDAASDDFETVFDEVTRWYSDANRAAQAHVFALRHREGASADEVYSSKSFQEFSAVLIGWVKKPVPALEGEALVGYVADSLMIDAHHSDNYDASPQLLSLEAECGTLYLLRSERERTQYESWVLGTLNSPDTEAALNGIYRFGGCTPAFADHAAACARCQVLLAEWENKAELPEGFEQFRRQPLRPPPPALPPLPPVSGVGIVIPRSNTAEPRPKKPWWKF